MSLIQTGNMKLFYANYSPEQHATDMINAILKKRGPATPPTGGIISTYLSNHYTFTIALSFDPAAPKG